MRVLTPFCTLIVLLGIWDMSTAAQPPMRFLSGHVLDAHGPVVGAYIRILPNGSVAISADDGYYRLQLPTEDSLRIGCNCIGYTAKTLPWHGEATLVFLLAEEVKEIVEVVVRANIHALDVRARTGNE